MEITLKDNFKISDSKSKIRGVVVLEDNKGNIIFKKENMIVKTGRKYLLNKIFLENTSETIKYIYLGTGNIITTPDMIYDDILATKKNQYQIGTEGFVGSVDINNIYYRIDANIQLAENELSYSLSELGLLLSDNQTLFSRVVFDPIILTKNRTYKVHYYIYF